VREDVAAKAESVVPANDNTAPPDLQIPVTGQASDSDDDNDNEADGDADGDDGIDGDADGVDDNGAGGGADGGSDEGEADGETEDDSDSEREADGDAEDGADGGEADGAVDGEADEPGRMPLDEGADEEPENSPPVVIVPPDGTSADHVPAPPEPVAKQVKPRKPRSSRATAQQANESVVVDTEVVADAAAPGQMQVETTDAEAMSDRDRRDFEHYNDIVVTAVKSSLEAGVALRTIRDRKLWRCGFPTWNAYCENVQHLTRRYANQLIEIAEAVEAMREVGNIFPTSTGLVPQAVTQVIPLLRIKDHKLRQKAWNNAVNRFCGGQPPASTVKLAVAKVLAKETKPASPAPISPTWERSQVERIARRLKAEVGKRQSWEDVERLVNELAEHIGIMPVTD